MHSADQAGQVLGCRAGLRVLVMHAEPVCWLLRQSQKKTLRLGMGRN